MNFGAKIQKMLFKREDDERTYKAWLDSYDVAQSIINGINNDPTDGATFFHLQDLSQEIFTTALLINYYYALRYYCLSDDKR